ncbi:MAG: GIY-YIG nuclease family protein [Elusimicrobium sp.]|jgi:putative endonuclease|nr:GIY-YIG nuclease family protein [Elusimicrobium sp.]
MNYTYILKCADDTLYTGWTNDLEKRLQAHRSGKGCKYTRSRCPVELVYFECFETKQEAQSREFAIKKMTHAKKRSLINSALK